jgi:uncharacterized Zn-binding protein involved in type VI secretion
MTPTERGNMTQSSDRNAEGSESATAGDTAEERVGRSNEPALTRRTALVGAGLGLGLLSSRGQASTGREGRPWNRDVDARGNDLLNLGGLNTADMDEGVRVADFDGPNLEIDDDSLRVTDHLDVAGIETSELAGDLLDGARVDDLVGENLGVTDGRLDAITHWRRRDVLLEPGDDDVDGIEVEDVESPDGESLHVGSDADLVLSISQGEGAVRIETGGGHEIVLDDESGSLSIEDSGGNSVEMDAATGEVTISAESKLTLNASHINLSAGGSLNLKSAGITDITGALVTLNGAGKPAARQGDPVEDGRILVGSPTVLIG